MKQSFGTIKGEPVTLYELENEFLVLKVMNYGATVVSIIDKATGIDIVKGYDSAEEYYKGTAHLGAFVGRTANRTRNAQFKLNGSTYHITANEHGVTNLHGGEGFDKKMYSVEEGENSVRFTRISPDGEEGYPGNMHVAVTYTLNGRTIEMKAEAVSDEDTLFAITNHNYYNLDGSDSILDHTLKINAGTYSPNDDLSISLDTCLPVAGTPFDFRTGKKLGTDINADVEQIQKFRGYDHHFEIEGTGMRTFAELTGKKLKLTVASDLPGMHMYTANFLDIIGKNGIESGPHSAVCIEPEYYPNAINYPGIEPKPVLEAGMHGESNITWTIEEL
ncbi:MAG: galactose mutarotase [Galactobacillus timonensis]|nr:galactose mutarotase [Galactobacillus timonensis]